MTTEERIKAALVRHPEWDDRHISRTVRGATLAMVRAVREGQSIPEPPAVKGEAGLVTLDAVRARYDIAAAIRREIARLKPGALVLEREFCLRVAGKDAARFRRTIENCAEFRANRVKLRLTDEMSEGAWYWGHPEDIKTATSLRDE